MRGLVAALVATGTLAGCTLAEFNSINRSFDPTDGDSRLIDVKQRAIYSIREPVFDPFAGEVVKYTDAHGNPQVLHKTVTCAEPSPDALQSTAAALGGNISAEQIQTALSGAGSTSESGASIGLRTQSITLLRDAYYRLCEGFASGAMDDIAFNVLQQRFQNHMVALLSVEQLTGATVAAQATTNTTAAGDAGANVSSLVDANGDAADRIASLELQRAQLQAQIADLKDPNLPDGTPKSPAQATADANRADTLETQDLPVLQGRISDHRAGLSSLQSALASATGAGPSASSSAGGTLGQQRSSDGSALPAHVSAAVTAITLNTLNQDYGLQLCIEIGRGVFTKGVDAANALRANPSAAITGAKRSIGNAVEDFKVSGLMVDYCRNRLQADANIHAQSSYQRQSRVAQINAVLNHLARHNIDEAQAAALLRALSEAVPNSPENVFQPDFGTIGGPICGEGTQLSADGRQCIPKPG